MNCDPDLHKRQSTRPEGRADAPDSARNPWVTWLVWLRQHAMRHGRGHGSGLARGDDEVAAQQRCVGGGGLPELPLLVARRSLQPSAAVEPGGHSEEMFVQMFSTRERLGKNLRVHKTREPQVEVKLCPRPRHDVHVRAGRNLSRERWERREETAQKKLQPRLRIPDARRGDDYRAAGPERTMEVTQQPQRIADVLQPSQQHARS